MRETQDRRRLYTPDPARGCGVGRVDPRGPEGEGDVSLRHVTLGLRDRDPFLSDRS